MNRIYKSALVFFLGCLTLGAHAADNTSAEMAIGADDFGCIRDLAPVGDFFVGNYLGDLDATIEIAASETGGTYPPGSIVQLVPGEAMVKHAEGFNPATKDWEFIELDVSAEETTIRKRGFVDVVNRFGGNCFACHVKAKPEFDMICKKDRGCDPIPLTPDMIAGIQNTDPRCEPVALPEEQIAALKQLKASMQQAAPEQ